RDLAELWILLAQPEALERRCVAAAGVDHDRGAILRAVRGADDRGVARRRDVDDADVRHDATAGGEDAAAQRRVEPPAGDVHGADAFGHVVQRPAQVGIDVAHAADAVAEPVALEPEADLLTFRLRHGMQELAGEPDHARIEWAALEHEDVVAAHGEAGGG